MKSFLLFVLTLVASTAFSQSPSAFKYQSVLLDKSGALISNKTVSVRVSLLRGKIDGATSYSETHSPTTSQSGIINLEIGHGTVASGSFDTLSWKLNTYFVKIEIDPLGGNAYELVGTSQLLSVPYSMFAQTSGDEKWDNVGGGINYKGGNVGIGTSAPNSSLEIDGPGTGNGFLITTKNNWSNAMAFYSAGNIDYLQSSIGMFRARGTYQSPAPILGGDRIGAYGAFGYTSGGAYNTGAAMEMYAGNSLGTYLLFGTTATPGATRTERMRITETGNVGIGTNNPAYTLDIAGTVNASSVLVNGTPVSSSPWNLSGNNLSYSAGNIGIGNTSPTANLDVVGLGSANASIITTRNNWSTSISAYTSGDVDYLQAGFLTFRSRGTWQSPTAVLAGDRIGSFGATAYTSGAAYNTGAAMEMYAGNSLGTYLLFGTTATPGATRTERMRITENGNVGIGTSNPAYTLDIAGTVNASSVLVNGAPVASSPWNLSASNLSYSAGNIGIGTSTPSSSLEIDGPGSSNAFLITTKNNSSNSIGVYAAGDVDYLQSGINMFRARGTYQSPTPLFAGDRIGSYGAAGYTSGASYNSGAAMEMYTGNSLGAYLIFGTTATPGATRTEQMRITETGTVIAQTSDVYINNIGSGVIMKSPNGTCYRMTVSDTGTPVFTAVACPQ